MLVLKNVPIRQKRRLTYLIEQTVAHHQPEAAQLSARVGRLAGEYGDVCVRLGGTQATRCGVEYAHCVCVFLSALVGDVWVSVDK